MIVALKIDNSYQNVILLSNKDKYSLTLINKLK